MFTSLKALTVAVNNSTAFFASNPVNRTNVKVLAVRSKTSFICKPCLENSKAALLTASKLVAVLSAILNNSVPKFAREELDTFRILFISAKALPTSIVSLARAFI